MGDSSVINCSEFCSKLKQLVIPHAFVIKSIISCIVSGKVTMNNKSVMVFGYPLKISNASIENKNYDDGNYVFKINQELEMYSGAVIECTGSMNFASKCIQMHNSNQFTTKDGSLSATELQLGRACYMLKDLNHLLSKEMLIKQRICRRNYVISCSCRISGN
eukprot:362011_1